MTVRGVLGQRVRIRCVEASKAAVHSEMQHQRACDSASANTETSTAKSCGGAKQRETSTVHVKPTDKTKTNKQ
jgi:hypothetical protein